MRTFFYKESRIVDISTCRILSICSGVGGLELGLKLAMPASRTVAYMEIEAYACEILVKRMEEALLDQAPIWTDVKSFDGKPWRGKVDLISGGYPCQPFSIAGKKLGDKDPRHLWPYVRRIVSEVEPTMCFFENVGGHLQLGFEQVHNDLCELGYKVKASLFTAQEVGAPHRRERLFILAYRDDSGCYSSRNDNSKRHLCSNKEWNSAEISENRTQLQSRFGENGETLADSDCLSSERTFIKGISERQPQRKAAHRGSSLGNFPKLADTECLGCRGWANGMERWKSCQTQVKRSRCSCRQLPMWPPKPDDYEKWRNIPEDLKPAVFRMADGMANRVDRVRACGNGVVPLVAAYAFKTLTSNIEFIKR